MKTHKRWVSVLLVILLLSQALAEGVAASTQVVSTGPVDLRESQVEDVSPGVAGDIWSEMQNTSSQSNARGDVRATSNGNPTPEQAAAIRSLCREFSPEDEVDVAVIQAVAGHWRMQEEDPDWDERFDLHGDEVVTVADVMLVAAVIGQPCPPDPDAEDEPSSFELIEDALNRGEIDQETALIYKVYVVFRDERLPDAYRGVEDRETHVPIIAEVWSQFDQLSPEGQAILEPFLAPPFYEGSWWDLRGAHAAADVPPCSPRDRCNKSAAWNYVGGEHVKVWYQERFAADDRPKAEAIVGHMEGKVWPTLTELMDRGPLPDDVDPTTNELIPNHGGDSRLDIALLATDELSDNGQASAYTGCKYTPAYVLIRRDIDGGHLQALLAHEFMHTIQFSYNVNSDCVHPGEHSWWGEASATWAEHYVYPDAPRTHQEFAPAFLTIPHISLNVVGLVHHYGAYLWPFFLQHEYGLPTLVRDMWDLTEGEDGLGSLEAMDQALRNAGLGGFAEQWPKFVLYKWNAGRWDYFNQWDELEERPEHTRVNVGLHGAPDGEYVMMQEDGDRPHRVSELNPLSATYYHFTFDDPDVRSVLFVNGLSFDISKDEHDVWGPSGIGTTYMSDPSEISPEGAHVWMLVKIDGEWKLQLDLTWLSGFTFCRDAVHQRVEEMVVVFSNSNYQPDDTVAPTGRHPKLWFSNMACLRWRGSAESEREIRDGVTLQVQVEDVVWERSPIDLWPDPDLIPEPPQGAVAQADRFPVAWWRYTYEITEGSFNWNVSGTWTSEDGREVCDYSGGDSRSLVGTESDITRGFSSLNYVVEGSGHRGIRLGLQATGRLGWTYTRSCEVCNGTDCEQYTDDINFAPVGPLFYNGPQEWEARVSEDGTLFEHERELEHHRETQRWRFEAESE